MERRESHDATAEQRVLGATRALLHIADRADVRAIAATLVGDLGGSVVEAGEDQRDVVPVDLSFGVGPPLLALPGNGVARMLLERFLPAFVQDGTRAIALIATDDRQSVVADIDEPTEHDRPDATFVAFSELTVDPGGREALVDAFRDRLRAVERADGFQRLEVWEDQSDPSAFTMVSWWDSRDRFLAYMRSDPHRASHDRVPQGEHAPQPARFRRFCVVAT